MWKFIYNHNHLKFRTVVFALSLPWTNKHFKILANLLAYARLSVCWLISKELSVFAYLLWLAHTQRDICIYIVTELMHTYYSMQFRQLLELAAHLVTSCSPLLTSINTLSSIEYYLFRFGLWTQIARSSVTRLLIFGSLILAEQKQANVRPIDTDWKFSSRLFPASLSRHHTEYKKSMIVVIVVTFKSLRSLDKVEASWYDVSLYTGSQHYRYLS